MNQLLLTVAGITVVALMSPGPNFVLITGRALSSGLQPAIATATGVAAGSLTHAIFGIIGFGAILRSSTSLFTIAKLVGSAYLIWIGVKSIRSAIRARTSANTGIASANAATPTTSVSVGRSLVDGYLTQMSNPKSTLFFLAMFTSVVPADVRLVEGAAVVFTIVLLAFLGYVAIAVLFSRPALQRQYRRFGFALDALFGGVMILLGVRIGLAER